MIKQAQCKGCGWLMDGVGPLCGPQDNRACYKRQVNPEIDLDEYQEGSSEYRVALCPACRLTPTYRDVCLKHLFEETVVDLMERWDITDSALYAVRKRRRLKYKIERVRKR